MVLTGKYAFTVMVKVNNCKQDTSGNPIVDKNFNTILDSWIYQLEFPDGRLKYFAVNFFDKSLFYQNDSDGWYVGLIDEVIDIQIYTSIAIVKQDVTFITD